MLITIDLVGDGDTVVDGGSVKKDEAEAQRLKAERKNAWMEWVRRNEAVVPQIVPVTQR